MNETAQQRFDAKYVSSKEIQNRLKVNSSAVWFALQRGSLPPAVVVGGNAHVWERVTAEPYIARWQAQLEELRAKRVHIPSQLELAE